MAQDFGWQPVASAGQLAAGVAWEKRKAEYASMAKADADRAAAAQAQAKAAQDAQAAKAREDAAAAGRQQQERLAEIQRQGPGNRPDANQQYLQDMGLARLLPEAKRGPAQPVQPDRSGTPLVNPGSFGPIEYGISQRPGQLTQGQQAMAANGPRFNAPATPRWSQADVAQMIGQGDRLPPLTEASEHAAHARRHQQHAAPARDVRFDVSFSPRPDPPPPLPPPPKPGGPDDPFGPFYYAERLKFISRLLWEFRQHMDLVWRLGRMTRSQLLTTLGLGGTGEMYRESKDFVISRVHQGLTLLETLLHHLAFLMTLRDKLRADGAMWGGGVVGAGVASVLSQYDEKIRQVLWLIAMAQIAARIAANVERLLGGGMTPTEQAALEAENKSLAAAGEELEAEIPGGK